MRTASTRIEKEVKAFCARIGADPLLVQGAGGNVSWKDDAVLWIKASGTWLAEAESKEIFVPVNLTHLQDSLGKQDFTVKPMVNSNSGLRPSIETLLHALMPHRIVVHLHAVDAVARLVQRNCEAELQAVLSDIFSWDLVGYHKPGADLVEMIYKKLLEKPDLEIILLKNHGIVLGAETLEEIDRILETLNQRLKIQPRSINNVRDSVAGFSSAALVGTTYQACPETTIHSLAYDNQLYERMGRNWAICPDHVVFLGASAVRINEQEDLLGTLALLDPAPPYVFVKDMGVLENRNASPAQRAQLKFYLDVMLRLQNGHLIDTLAHDQISGLFNWDAEKYRQSINQILRLK